MARADFRPNLTQTLEHRGLQQLRKRLEPQGFKVQFGNIPDKTAPDYLVTDLATGQIFLADFQFSRDFRRYGDIRVDVVSVYSKCDSSQRDRNCSFTEFLARRYQIQKMGKIFGGQIAALNYWIFNEGITDATRDIPDKIYEVSVPDLLEWLNDNWKKYPFQENRKQELGDTWGSAFLCVKLDDLLRDGIGQEVPYQT